MTGPRAPFCRPSISQLLLPAHKFNFQRPLCTSRACDYPETRTTEEGQERKQRRRGGPPPLPSAHPAPPHPVSRSAVTGTAARSPGSWAEVGGSLPQLPLPEGEAHPSPLPTRLAHLLAGTRGALTRRWAVCKEKGLGTGQRPTQRSACRGSSVEGGGPLLDTVRGVLSEGRRGHWGLSELGPGARGHRVVGVGPRCTRLEAGLARGRPPEGLGFPLCVLGGPSGLCAELEWAVVGARAAAGGSMTWGWQP